VKENKKLIVTLLTTILTISLLVILYQGVVFMYLFNWIVAPSLNLSEVGFWKCLFVTLLIRLVFNWRKEPSEINRDRSETTWVYNWSVDVVGSLMNFFALSFFLLIGWVIQLFI